MTLVLPRLHLVSDDAVLALPSFVEMATIVIEAGAPRLAFHLRGPHTGGRALYRIATALAPVARGAGAEFYVNDRVDVALALGTGGVHLGGRSLAPTDARALLGPGPTVGLSVPLQGRPSAALAYSGGADFLIAGSVFPTGSHPGRPGAGWKAFSEAVSRAGSRPVMAIGGITLPRVAGALRAGAHGVAVLGGVWHNPDPVRAVMAYIDELKGDRPVPAREPGNHHESEFRPT